MKRIEQRVKTGGNRVGDPVLISLLELSNCFSAVARANSGVRQILFPNSGAGRGSLPSVCFGPFEVGIALISREKCPPCAAPKLIAGPVCANSNKAAPRFPKAIAKTDRFPYVFAAIFPPLPG